jgi:SAM-dependent methyltransferase
MSSTVPDYSSYEAKYLAGEWRARIFRDLVLADVRRIRQQRPVTLLDIGCGRGFDDSLDLQASLVKEADRSIGIEPDEAIGVAKIFDEVHLTLFEDAPIPPQSVDVAFCVMVLEHVEHPELFWRQLTNVLRPGGVFWGFTIDARNWFAKASMAMKKAKLANRYLSWLHGAPAKDRYENYPVFYRANTPERIAELSPGFSSVSTHTLWRKDQPDFYFPRGFRFVGRALDAMGRKRGEPGALFMVRLES